MIYTYLSYDRFSVHSTTIIFPDQKICGSIDRLLLYYDAVDYMLILVITKCQLCINILMIFENCNDNMSYRSFNIKFIQTAYTF